LLGLIIIGIAYTVSLYPMKRETVAHGVLDLTGWDGKRDETVELDGEWECRQKITTIKTAIWNYISPMRTERSKKRLLTGRSVAKLIGSPIIFCK
jgi:hypothetical protein